MAVAFAVAMALLLEEPKAAAFAASTTPVCPTPSDALMAAAAACNDSACQTGLEMLRVSICIELGFAQIITHFGVVGSIERQDCCCVALRHILLSAVGGVGQSQAQRLPCLVGMRSVDQHPSKRRSDGLDGR